MPYTLELIYRVHDDSDGSYIHIGADPDDPGILEIRDVYRDGQSGDRLVMSREQAGVVAEGIQRFLAQRPKGE